MKTRLSLVIFVLILASAGIASVNAQDGENSDFVQIEPPPWEPRYEFLLGFEIAEGGTLTSRPKISTTSDYEAAISIGNKALIGNRDELTSYLLGCNINVKISEYLENRFQLKFTITMNRLTRLEEQRVSVDKGTYNGGHIVQVGEKYTLVDLSTEGKPVLKITCTLERAEATNWVNVAPVTVMAEAASLEKILDTIGEQAEIEFVQEDGVFEDVPVVSAFFTDVPCDKALRSIGDHCGFTVRFERESNSCIIKP